MAEPKFGYTRFKTVDGSVDFIANTLVVPNGSLQLSEAESAELSGGTGDVVGPASSVNDRVAVFDGTTGKLIKDGGATIGDIVAGVGAAPLSATYITQTPNATLTNEQALSTLATGLLKNTTTTGVLSIALAGTDYLSPTGNGSGLTSLNATQLTSGTIPDARFPATLPAISGANLSNLNATNLFSGTVPAARMPALTGDVTSTVGTVATTIANNAVSLAKLADIATASFLGRNTAGTGDPEVLSIATAKTMLGLTGTLTQGSVVFAGVSGSYSEDNANFFWDDTNNRLGILTNAPTQPLQVAGNVFISSATANLFLKDTSTGFQSASTTVITPQASNAIRSTSYTSGLVGWNISALGNAEFNNVDIRGAIRASIFTFNSINATAGTLGVFKASGKLRTLTSTPVTPSYGVSTINVEIVDIEGLSHAASQIFAVNDILRLKDPLAGDVWLKVSSVSDQTTFWRYVSIVMAGTANATFNPGLGVPNYGPANAGFIIQTADQTNSPYLQMATHLATFTSQDASGSLIVTPRLRIGNLNGSYGYAADTYGFGTGQYGVASQNWLTVDTANGIRIGNNTTVNGQWATDGEIVVGPVAAGLNNLRLSPVNGLQLRTNTTVIIGMGFSGDLIVGQQAAGQSNVLINAGQIDIRNNTTPRIRLAANGSGFLANSNISWDTSGNLTVTGNATIGGWAITSTSFSSGSGGTTVAMDSGGTNPAFYAGSATPGNAPFRVTNAGALTATNASITGAVTATSGAVGGWTIASTKISSTGIDLHSGANAGLAFGTTPPTSATSGTGIWLDRLGLVALSSNSGLIGISASGIEIAAGTTKTNRDYRFVDNLGADYLAGTHCLFSAGTPSTISLVLEANSDNDTTGVVIKCHGGTSQIQFTTSTTAGGARDTIVINGGMVMGGASGGAKGLGTLNLSGDIYKNNVAYTSPDYVFEHWATGKIDKFANKPGASEYKGLRPLAEVREFVRSNYHLPGFGQKAEHGLFSGGDQLLLSVEQAYLYIFELEQQIQQLKRQQ